MLVMKFGGTSVGDADAIRRVTRIIRSRVERKPVVVVSAVAKTTDELVSLFGALGSGDQKKAEQILELILNRHRVLLSSLGVDQDPEVKAAMEEARERLQALSEAVLTDNVTSRMRMDVCLSTGEFLSANIVASFLRKEGLGGVWVDSTKVMVTDSKFGRAHPIFGESEPRARDLVVSKVGEGKIPIMQGFVGADLTGRTTTLGRGGSDFSATFIGALVGASVVEIWTDVDGVMTADPSLVSSAKRIPEMSFQEAAELAYFGAKVLHPSTLLPAVEKGIPVQVLNSWKPEEGGTKIICSAEKPKERGPAVLKSIAYKEGLTVLNIRSSRMLLAYGFLAAIFEVFNRYETSVDLVSTSEVSVSVTIDDLEKLDQILLDLARFSEVEVSRGKAIVCCVGEDICLMPGMPARIFKELEDTPILVISQGASDINISFVIDEVHLPGVVSRLHSQFFSETEAQSVS